MENKFKLSDQNFHRGGNVGLAARTAILCRRILPVNVYTIKPVSLHHAKCRIDETLTGSREPDHGGKWFTPNVPTSNRNVGLQRWLLSLQAGKSFPEVLILGVCCLYSKVKY